jgi:hypothetical protein
MATVQFMILFTWESDPKKPTPSLEFRKNWQNTMVKYTFLRWHVSVFISRKLVFSIILPFAWVSREITRDITLCNIQFTCLRCRKYLKTFLHFHLLIQALKMILKHCLEMLGHSLTKFRAPVYDFSGRTARNDPAGFQLVSSQNLLKGIWVIWN